MVEFDPGPPPVFADLFARLPDYGPFKDRFWYDWGPIFYRGRLDGSARVLCVGSDPGPTERIALRTLVGDAGQRVQGFLTRLGLTRSYICVNAFAYALHPSAGGGTGPLLNDPAQRAWRNDLFDLLKTPNIQAVIAFGAQAQKAVQLWPGRGAIPLFAVPHPSSRDATQLLDAWRTAVTQLRAIVTPDPDGDATGPNYGPAFLETDYARIPPRDLPFGLPPWMGDDSWGRTATPHHNNSVSRPATDDEHTLVWIAPRS
jgi:uracil-DNA glycosylase